MLEELAALAAEEVRGDGLRLMDEGGLLPELARHLMQAALKADMDEHLAAEAGRAVSGRAGSSRVRTIPGQAWVFSAGAELSTGTHAVRRPAVPSWQVDVRARGRRSK